MFRHHRIETKNGCIIIYGSVPIEVLATIFEEVDPLSVISNELQVLLGATIVVGTRENLALLKQAT